jgi:hypothetical protein
MTRVTIVTLGRLSARAESPDLSGAPDDGLGQLLRPGQVDGHLATALAHLSDDAAADLLALAIEMAAFAARGSTAFG